MSSTSPVTILTGAGSGIGRATAENLSRLGHAVVLVGRRRDRLEKTAEGLEGPSFVEAADVSDPERARPLVFDTLDRYGRLDNLINCAGLAPSIPINETTPHQLQEIFAVNAFASSYLISAAWPVFVRQRRGCIVNISSMSTDSPFPGLYAYSASKASVELMAKSCASEGAEFGIRAFAVAPGAVETEMLRAIATVEELPPENCLQPADVATVIAECITGDRDDMNGQIIRVPSP